MTRRVLAVVAADLLVAGSAAAALLHLGFGRPGMPLVGLAYAVVLTALLLLPPVYVELRRQTCGVTVSDVALLFGLFLLGPGGFVLYGGIAELAATLISRRGSWLKLLFNLVHAVGGLVVGGLTFAALGEFGWSDPRAWAAATLALGVIAVWDLLSASAVFAITERQSLPGMIRGLVPSATANWLVSATLGIAAVVLHHATPLGLVLFAPVVAILFWSAHSVGRQRAARQRLQRLYEASSGLTRLVSMPDTLSGIAAEARTLLTGAVALCCTRDEEGRWTGMRVDDDGARPASGPSIDAVVDLVGDERIGERPLADLERWRRHLLPSSATLVWAWEAVNTDKPVLLVVFREVADSQPDHRPEVLHAFVSHAATVVANMGLHEDVQRALDRQVELNRQKSEFVAAVSHELRTPLAGMLGSLQTLRRFDDRVERDVQERLVTMGIEQGDRLKSLIEDLLLVAAADHRRVTIETEGVDVARMIDGLVAEMTTRTDRVQGRCAPWVPEMVTDGEKVRRILTNLVENALKYAPDGPISIEADSDGEQVVLSVSDRGPGIPEADRERVFERFVQLDQSATRRQGGTGLGLHLCRQLAELLGGSLQASEARGGGARFELRLPVRLASSDAGAAGAGVRQRPAAMRATDGGATREDEWDADAATEISRDAEDAAGSRASGSRMSGRKS